MPHFDDLFNLSLLNVIFFKRTHKQVFNDIPLLSALFALTYISCFVAPVAHQLSFYKFTSGAASMCEKEMKGLPYLAASKEMSHLKVLISLLTYSM